ncbi:MAG: hypothetical protein SOH58_00540, partial [Olsenella sp.]
MASTPAMEIGGQEGRNTLTKKDGRYLLAQVTASAMNPTGIIPTTLFYAGGLLPARVDLLA